MNSPLLLLLQTHKPKDMNRTTQTKVCQALSVLLLLTLSLCVDHTASRPSTENEGGASTLPPGADNIEVFRQALTLLQLSLELTAFYSDSSCVSREWRQSRGSSGDHVQGGLCQRGLW